jgi:hypothetical protein
VIHLAALPNESLSNLSREGFHRCYSGEEYFGLSIFIMSHEWFCLKACWLLCSVKSLRQVSFACHSLNFSRVLNKNQVSDIGLYALGFW